jgi:hypothetical protein
VAQPAKKPSQGEPSQKEMLMPIAGKNPAKETAAKKPAARQRKSGLGDRRWRGGFRVARHEQKNEPKRGDDQTE